MKRKPMLKRIVIAGAISANAAAAAHAHATLEVQEASVNSTYKAVLRVPHGCDGKPTHTVRIRIPEGVIAVKPMPKPGWTLEKVRGAYEKSYDYYGTELKEGVKEIIWSGGNLLDDEYDEFIFRGLLSADLPAGEMLYFPTVQECEGAVERWIEIPAGSQDPNELEGPAPGIKLLPAVAGQ